MRKSALFALGLVVAALVALGLVVLASASEANALKYHHDAYYFLKRQGLYLVAGLFIAVIVALVDYRRWRDDVILSWLFYGVVVVMLGAVLFMPAVKGSHRWLPLGFVNLQPSELAKLAVVIMLAVWLDRASWRVELFTRGVLWPVAIAAVPIGLILAEPDFGSVMVVGGASALLMFVAGSRILHALPFVLGGAAIGLALVLTNENRFQRLFDESKQYQANMALVALQNGGLTGVGLGQSMQKQYYLPEAHTDFIFAIGAEELGLGFSIGVIALFLAFFALTVYIARRASDKFGRYLVVGMSFIVFFQAMFNLGVVSAVLPTKGMALPFFSYGGTNLLSAFFAVGMILSVGIHSFRDSKRTLRASVLVR